MPSERGRTRDDVWRDGFYLQRRLGPVGLCWGILRLPLGSRGECWDRLVMSAGDTGGAGEGRALAGFQVFFFLSIATHSPTTLIGRPKFASGLP